MAVMPIERGKVRDYAVATAPEKRHDRDHR
jgi:hypothetical protein